MVCLCEMIGLACFVALVFSFSSKAPYQLKMTAFFFGSGILVLIWLPFMIFRPKDYRNALVPAWGCRMLGQAIGITMEVRGLENVRKEHGSIVLMNHQSALDLIVLAYLWPVIGRATVVSKREILYIPFFGIGAWLWGTLFINRSKSSDSIKSLNKQSKAIHERNCKLLLFPEGTRNSNKDKLLPFKKGSFHIATQNQCPIQPVVISHYYFLNSSKKIFKKGHAIIHILPEIESKGYDKDNINVLVDDCQNIMQQEYTRLTQESKLIKNKKTY
ncbi:putative 1-acyl-sn-glycerol-3-phosphate acyltransferase acl-2 [Condylostylus longicornis]|uniref:putative 1-acyl-sn-glycerol-3-phosphate acyltransferase acl-2 n=1 Tax=Condylostylus longicornis TaxID=2530218 RepID=UPI00244E50DD|nr:putative 1-acyl-sn-glycerol-3-phosphate acyltransferase acl-2 [Condylostylus longicornis]